MALLETRGDYDFAHNVEALKHHVEKLETKMTELTSINDELCKINSRLLNALMEQTDAIRIATNK